MGELREMTTDESVALLAAQAVGRAAICTPSGPYIVPVNYSVHEDSVVFRTAPYSVLGSYGWAGDIAFEVDHFDTDTRTGWSVVAVGRGEMVENAEDLADIRWAHEPKPWAEGTKPLYLRLQWREVTGRRIA